MDESFRKAIPNPLYIKCPKAAFEQSAATFYDSGLVHRLFFSNPKDLNVSEGEIVLEVDAAAFQAGPEPSSVKDGCWKSRSPLFMAHIREYKQPPP